MLCAIIFIFRLFLEILDDRVTHVVAPSYARTMKVLQAILDGKWVVCPEWVEKSYECGRWLDESDFGFRRQENPIQGKKIFLTEGFLQSYRDELTLRHCQQLVVRCALLPLVVLLNQHTHTHMTDMTGRVCLLLQERGQGSFTSDPHKADFILLGKPRPGVSEAEEQARYQREYAASYVCEVSE